LVVTECFVADAAAQAELGESRKIKGTLNKDQHYYFKIKAKKSRNGVRVQVIFLSFFVISHLDRHSNSIQ